MSLQVTLYPDENANYWRTRPGNHAFYKGRAVCSVEVDGARIQTNTWEAMQVLIDALSAEVASAKHAEQDAALAPLNRAVA